MTLGSGSNPTGSGRCRAVLAMVLFVLPLLGCSGGEPLRIPGGGHVSLGEKDVSDFSITFIPAAGVTGPSVGTTVNEGEYNFNTKNGPAAPGSYRVIIQAPVVPVPRTERAKGGKVEKQRQWEFEFTVPDKGRFTKDFDLN